MYNAIINVEGVNEIIMNFRGSESLVGGHGSIVCDKGSICNISCFGNACANHGCHFYF